MDLHENIIIIKNIYNFHNNFGIILKKNHLFNLP